MADVEKKILKQVEFYFSNSNLPKDTFMKSLVEQNDGWVDIAKLASFPRMQKLSTDFNVVVEAIKKSAELLQVNAEGTHVKRVVPLPDKPHREPCWVYAKGFDVKANLDELEEWWQSKGNVLCVRMRRMSPPEKAFKGSVFVEFDTEDNAKKFLSETHNAPGTETPLVTKSRTEYFTQKREERNARIVAKGGVVSDAKAPAGDAKVGQKRKADELEAGKEEAAEAEQEEVPEIKETMVKDLIVHISEGLGADTTREMLKELLESVGASVRYTDYSRGQATGFVRLHDVSAVKASECVAALAEAKKEINGVVPTLRALAGEEEEEYWKNILAKMTNSKGAAANKAKQRGGPSRGGRGGRGRGGKRGGKRQKV